MLRLIPGLSGLKAFEAAGRHLSFTKAAHELGVTPAAVSHQIKELESQLSTGLFVRTSRTMRLTREGEVFHAAASDALDSLRRALARIGKSRAGKQLRVTTSPSISAKWLVPRLERFLSIYPDADVRIDVSQAALDLEHEDVDIAIRFGNGNYPGLKVDRLFEETIFPVCSPGLLKAKHLLREPRDLLRHKLIHMDWQAQGATWPNWRMWMLAAGIKEFDDTRGLHFSQTSLALQAAIDGQGVALGESTLVADDLAAGRLVRPFDLALKGPPQFAYHVISPLETCDAPMIKAFREWLLREAAATVAGQG